MKRKAFCVWTIGITTLFLCACGTAEEPVTPTITTPPKVLIVDAATPTPTLTLEQGELPESSEEELPTETPVPTQAEVTPEPQPTATKAPTATPAPTPTSKPTETPVPTKAEARPYEKGTLTETEFISEWLGMKFIPATGMELSSQEELDEIMRVTEEVVYGKEIKGALDYESLSLVYEMSLSWPDKGLTLQLTVEPVSDEAFTEADYEAKLREELNLLEESGFQYIVDDKTYSETIAGKEFVNFGYTTYYGDGLFLHQENYFRKQDDRMILISIIGELEIGMQELIKQFQTY